MQDNAKAAAGAEFLVKATGIISTQLLLSRALLQTQQKAKKPANFNFIINTIQAAAKEGGDIKFAAKPKGYDSHAQCVVDGLNIFTWFAIPASDMKETMAAHLGGIDFHGNKVLMKKVDSDTKWYKSYKVLATAFKDFIVSNAYELMWKGQEADAEKIFESMKGESAGTPSIPEPKKEEAKKPMPTAAATKVVAKAPTKKEPKHYWRSCQYMWDNYEKQDLLFEEEEDCVDSNTALFFDNCKQLNITVKGKIKQITVSNCKKIKI